MTKWSWEPLDLDEVVALLEGFPARWWIAGGRALELFLGRSLREHGDIDVEVLRDDQRAIKQHLRGWDIQIAHGGKLEPWPEGQPVELPRSGLWARSTPDGPWQIQFLLAEHDGETWRYRRDPNIALPITDTFLRSDRGVPYLRPELVLLWKSPHRREQDEADLEAVLPALDPAARARLEAWLAPDHPWRSRL